MYATRVEDVVVKSFVEEDPTDRGTPHNFISRSMEVLRCDFKKYDLLKKRAVYASKSAKIAGIGSTAVLGTLGVALSLGTFSGLMPLLIPGIAFSFGSVGCGILTAFIVGMLDIKIKKHRNYLLNFTIVYKELQEWDNKPSITVEEFEHIKVLIANYFKKKDSISSLAKMAREDLIEKKLSKIDDLFDMNPPSLYPKKK